MKYKKVKDLPKHNENPFLEKAIEEITYSKKTQIIRPTNRSEIQMIVSDGGNVEGYSAFMRFVEVDEDKFAKLYLSQFESFWELSKAGIRVFGYIINMIKPNKDTFMLRMDMALEYTKYSHANSVYSGIADLIEHGIVARGKYESEYYINPLVVFNGSRVTFAKTYVKKKKETFPINQIELFENGKQKEIQNNSES